MLDLVKYIIGVFAEKPDEVEYNVTENGNNVDIQIILNDSDMGKVIGRQGKIAKAMRTLVKAASSKDDKKYNIEIKERGEI